MYVCICRGITDSTLRDAAARYPERDARRLCRDLGVATDCGRCARTALAIVHETQADMHFQARSGAHGVVQMYPQLAS